MPTFEKADATVNEIVTGLVGKYHKRLADVGVRLAVLMAHAKLDKQGEPRDTPVKFGGYKALAIVKVTTLRERTLGQADAVITIDGDKWPDLTAAEQKALIDHELEHLEPHCDRKTGEPLKDDRGRPRLYCRLHDWQLGGFDAVARRHKEHSIEVKAVRALRDWQSLEQLTLFAKD
jgi:hypothetical protein